MSSLSEAIQYAQQGVSKCEELAGVIASSEGQLSDLEGILNAGLGDTESYATLNQYREQINGELTGAAQAVQQLKSTLMDLMARFQGAAGSY